MEQGLPKISVVVTVYNVEQYMKRCIESVLTQSFKDFELIIVDDKTPDNSMDIAKNYADKDSRIHLVYNGENCGLMWARKVGVEKSQGKYIVYLDSDDTLPNNALQLFYDEIERSGVDMVSGNIVYKKLDGQDEVWTSSLPYGNDKQGVYKALLLNKYKHNLCGHIIRRSLLTDCQYKYYKAFTKWEDYCLFYQLVNNSSYVGHIDEPVYNYFQTVGSSTQVKISERNLETTVIAHKVAFDLLCENNDLKTLVYRNFQYCFCNLYRNGYKNVKKYLEQYELLDVISSKNILYHNGLKQAIRLLIMKII